MSELQSQLQQITRRFVAAIVSTMNTASLSDLLDTSRATAAWGVPVASPGRRSEALFTSKAFPTRGRRKRSSSEEVQRQKDIALAAAKALKPGFGKGDVMKKAGSTIDLGRALSLL